jgi:DNA-binding NarL/FixJ family response regulator
MAADRPRSLDEPGQPGTGRQPAQPQRRADALRLVICDDSAATRRLLELALAERPELQVVAAGVNGQDAVTLAARHRPDVMILDEWMPDRDGISALPHLLAVSPATRVVLYTSDASPAVRDAALAAGAAEVIDKAAPLRELLAAITRPQRT